MPDLPGTIILHPDDSVAVLTERTDTADGPLGAGHKLARTAIPRGAPVIKFGQFIGNTTDDIGAGAHVHSHNCAFAETAHTYEPGSGLEAARAAIPSLVPALFEGYRRANGQAGTRNYIALCATVNCSATVVRRAADALNSSGLLDDFDNIDGVVALSHGTGCAMAPNSPGYGNLQRVLWGHATHPNVAAAIFVGLGCEVMQIARMKAMFGSDGDERFHGLTIQETGGTTKTVSRIVAMVRDLLPEVNATRREPIPATELKLALQCGGSDGFSGITANPALGVASDLLVGMGGTAVLAETPEIYGAEQLLLRRAVSGEVADKLMERINWWKEYTAINGASMDNNPSPGNKAGGLTTILEKSLGAAAKGGSTPLADVLQYGEICQTRGLVFMDSPGYDPASVTGQIASGCQIVAFTTGRGSAFGSKPAPTIKLATNDRLYGQMTDDMDINCGDIVSTGTSLRDKGHEILDKVLRVASGEKSRSEALGLGDNEFVPWQVGAVM